MEKWNVGILIFEVQSVGDHADVARGFTGGPSGDDCS
jgi:hypothetical protein